MHDLLFGAIEIVLRMCAKNPKMPYYFLTNYSATMITFIHTCELDTTSPLPSCPTQAAPVVLDSPGAQFSSSIAWGVGDGANLLFSLNFRP